MYATVPRLCLALHGVSLLQQRLVIQNNVPVIYTLLPRNSVRTILSQQSVLKHYLTLCPTSSTLAAPRLQQALQSLLVTVVAMSSTTLFPTQIPKIDRLLHSRIRVAILYVSIMLRKHLPTQINSLTHYFNRLRLAATAFLAPCQQNMYRFLVRSLSALSTHRMVCSSCLTTSPIFRSLPQHLQTQ